VRMMLKGRAVTAIALVALALGIGANTAIFSVVNAVLLRPLPYKNADELVMLWQNNPSVQVGFDMLPVTVADFIDWRDQSQVFENISILESARLALTGLDRPERIGGAAVSASFFDLMGAEPIMGRVFRPEEDQPGANQVAVVSYALWQSRFAAAPDIVGRTMTLDGKDYTIVGVMPKGFQFPRSQDLPSYFQMPPQTELWTPIGLTSKQIANRGSHNKAVIARLKPNITLEQAQAEMSTIASRLEKQYKEDEGYGVTVLPMRDQLVGDVRAALWVLLGAVGFVLLIACANVANLLLARAASRQKEIAIRTALGASRGRVLRQLLTESVLLSALGGLLGVLLAVWGIDVLLAVSPDNIPRKDEIGIDGAVMGFTLLISLMTGVLFGLAPALQASRFNLNETLKEGVRGSTGGHNRVSGLLVVAEVALSLVLLVGAGLMTRSFSNILRVDPGFTTENLLSMQIALPDNKYPEDRQQVAFFEQALERIRALPGAGQVSAVSDLPLSGTEEIDQFTIEGRPAPPNLNDTPLADFRFIDHDYFATMGTPLLAGRPFTEQDNAKSPGVVIISESLARRYFPDEDPLGKRIRPGDAESKGPWLTIIGVVTNVKHSGLEADPRPQLYFPYPQKFWGRMTIVARTSVDPKSFTAAMRDAVWAIDKDQPITNVETMEQYLAASVSHRRFNLIMLAAFSVIALILAGAGLYGVMSYSVTQRTHEIGIRMALGAKKRDILRLVLRQGLILVVAGLAIGLSAAFALTRFLSSILFGVSATDPVAFAGVSAALAIVALAACYVPARRAVKVDPMVALRYE
ncbi:MAG: ABC transporter permease, partial [Blastocatellia bacterium]